MSKKINELKSEIGELGLGVKIDAITNILSAFVKSVSKNMHCDGSRGAENPSFSMSRSIRYS